MPQSIPAQKVQVLQHGPAQMIQLPTGYSFATDEVYIKRDPLSGGITLFEERPRPTSEEIQAMFDELDAAGAGDFVLERDLSLPIERDEF